MNKKKEKNENQNNKIPKTHEITRVIFKYILTFFIVIIIFVGLLTLSSTFPKEWIQKNTAESAIILKELGNPSKVLNTLFDNDTDTLMINTAYSINPAKPLESALLARRNYLPEREQTVYQDIYVESNVQTTENYIIQEQLIRTVESNINESFEYAISSSS